jgi:hypothetical protein
MICTPSLIYSEDKRECAPNRECPSARQCDSVSEL